MSLATRCPVCQTVFRVVQDQLKVSEGWVRCGRCAKVFNAFEGLFDLEREFPALRSPSPSQRVLEDLARRNPRPQPSPQWEQELDTRAGVRDASQPSAPAQTPAAPSRPNETPPPFRASQPFAPSQPGEVSPPVRPSQPFSPSQPFAPSQPPRTGVPAPATQRNPITAPPTAIRLPATAAEPAPTKPAQLTPALVAQPAATRPAPSMPIPAAAAAPPREALAPQATTALREAPAPTPATTPNRVGRATPATAAAQGDEAATLPPRSATAPSGAAAPAARPVQALRAAPPAVPPKVAAPAARDVDIRDEPMPVPGDEPDSSGGEQSFEALFRSDGEMAEPATAAHGVDIMLDSDGVEPASLDPDDAVDSRLLTFVQQADKAERWRRPWVRVTLALSALALTLLLGLQIVVARRDAVAAQWPGSRTLLQTLCAPFECRIEPLRRIDQISVDSSGLTRIDDGPVYRLALVLRNRGETPLLSPAIDLSLTDASGALVTRRMLSASELGAARTTIAAGQELPLQALLMSSERPLTGYTIEIFYP